MSEELRQLLVIIAVAMPLGLFIGLVLRRYDPEGAKKIAIRSLTYTWRFWLFGCAMFAVLTLSQIAIGRYWFAVFFAVGLFLQLYNLLQSLRPNRDITAKVQAMEDWNPKKIWPLFPTFSKAPKKKS